MEPGTNAWTRVGNYVARVALGLSRRSALNTFLIGGVWWFGNELGTW